MILILKKLRGAFLTVTKEAGQIKSPEKYVFEQQVNFSHRRELQDFRPD